MSGCRQSYMQAGRQEASHKRIASYRRHAHAPIIPYLYALPHVVHVYAVLCSLHAMAACYVQE